MALSLWLLLLSACEGGTTYTKTIENKSTEEVRLKVYTSLAPTGQEKSVNPGSTAEIYWQDDMGRFADATYDCLNDVDSIIIELSGDKKIHKDIMNPGEWYRRSRSGRNSREDCLFTISDQDVY